MSELHVVALIQAKPGSEPEVRGALEALVAPTRAEDGCIAYDLYTSAADPSTFVTVERWHSQDALDAHLQTEHVQQAFGAAGDALAGPPAIHALLPTGD